MFPGAFDYRAPSSLEEAVAVLAEAGDDAKVLSGGQSLLPLLKLRLASPSVLVDIGRIPGLTQMEVRDDELRIGGRTRHVDIDRNPALAGVLPILLAAARQVADPLVRNAGTVAGSLCHADPAGDWGSVMLATNASVVATSKRGERVIPAAEFFLGPFTTALQPDEIVSEIRIPAPARSAGTYLKLERKVGDFATAAVAVQVEMANGHIGRAGIGLTAVGPTNLRAAAAEAALAGQAPSAELIDHAAELAAADARPHDDVRGSAEYKRDVVRVFVKRALTAAIARARGGQA